MRLSLRTAKQCTSRYPTGQVGDDRSFRGPDGRAEIAQKDLTPSAASHSAADQEPVNGWNRYHAARLPTVPVKKPLTAETAEAKTLRILGVLCELCVQTSHFFIGSPGLPETRTVAARRSPSGVLARRPASVPGRIQTAWRPRSRSAIKPVSSKSHRERRLL